MKLTRLMHSNIYRRILGGTGIFMVWVFVVVFLGLLVSGAQDSKGPKASGLLQEKIGYTVQVLGLYDQKRLALLQERWATRIQQIGNIQNSQPGRLQEALGQAIAHAGLRILNERDFLERAVMEAKAELRRFKEERSSRRQEHLGTAIVVAARQAPGGGDAFEAAFQRRMQFLERLDERTGQRLESRMRVLLARQADFPNTVTKRYQEAMDSAERSVRMRGDSEVAWVRHDLEGLRDELTWRRQPDDYVELAGGLGEILSEPRRESANEGYGLMAMLGLGLTMLWISSITRSDQPVGKVFEAEKGGPAQVGIQGAQHMSQSVILFSWPKEVLFGKNVSLEVGRYAVKDGKNRVMIVTDAGVRRDGLLDTVETSFSRVGIEFKIYDQVRHEVPDTMIHELLDVCRQEKTDLLVAVGGGSVIDTAKAAGILMTNGGRIQDYEGADTVFWPIPRFYVVPTTAGCGSEASQFCVVLDTHRKKKIEIFSRQIIPQRIFIDPMLTLTMPAELTASSGIDALANCVEAYFSTWASPLTDALSLHAIRLIARSLRDTVANPIDLEARQKMAMAAFEAGLAFTNAHAGAVHALGHSISGLLNVPQRLGNAILLPHVMRHNMKANLPRMVDVAVAMGEPVTDMSSEESAEKAVNAVQCLLEDIQLPTTLDQVGVSKESISDLSRQALQDAFLKTNPGILARVDIERIYEKAFEAYSESVHTASGHHRV